MANLKYLYYFSSPQIDVIEIKRLDLKGAPLSEIYKWLIVGNESEKIWELDFKSMNKFGNKELRTFITGSLTFDNQEAVLSLFDNELQLKVMKPKEISPKTVVTVENYIMNKIQESDLTLFRN